MTEAKYGLTLAAKEHIARGEPITRLEAIVLYGVSNLTDMITEMRRNGFLIDSYNVPYARAVVRLNNYATLKPPSNLPIRDITLTEYKLKK